MNIKPFAVATLSTLLVGSSIFAQETQPPRTKDLTVRSTPVQSTGDSRTKDQTLALCLAIADQEQVLLSQFAKDRATHADVKAFAAALEKAHQTSVEQLKAFSPPTTAIGATADRAKQADANRADANRADANRADANRAELTETSLKQVDDKSSKVDFLQLHQEISAQCLKDSKEMLTSKKGVEFDQCFVGMQIAKHASSHSTLTVMQRHSTGKLQEWIKTALETNAQHMEAAVTLMDKLAEADSSPATR
jgi:predicted outer membrane protein